MAYVPGGLSSSGAIFRLSLNFYCSALPRVGHTVHTESDIGRPTIVGVGSQCQGLALKTPPGRNTSSQYKVLTNSWAVPHLGPTCTHLGGPPPEAQCLPSDGPGTGPWFAGSDGRQVWHTSPVSSGPWLGSWQPAHSLPQ